MFQSGFILAIKRSIKVKFDSVMGNQPSTKIRPELLKVEVDFIKSHQLCSAGLRHEIDADIKVMLRSINQPVDNQSIEGQTPLQPEIKEVLLDRINEYRLSDEVDQRFFDPQVMSMITCLYGNLLTTDKELFQATSATKNYFRLTKNLSVGNWGIVFQARNSGSELNFIIKTQVNPSLADMSIHEIFVALKAINPLRALCPNFSVLYGGFVCGNPDGISGQLCGGKFNVPYSLYEAVPGSTLMQASINLKSILPIGQTLETSIDKTYAEILSSLLQMYFALKIAHHRASDFSHRDLHDENIILRPLNRDMLIRYRSQFMRPIQPGLQTMFDYYVRCSSVATIIDYDMCEVYLKLQYSVNDIRTERFGKSDADPLGRPISGDPNLSHLRDMAKLLGFTAYRVVNSKASPAFKLLIADIYIQTIQPALPDRYRANQPQATVLNTKMDNQGYNQVLVRERESYFQLTNEQVRLNREGLLTFDRFFEVFTRLVPTNYLSYLLAIDNVKVHQQDNPINDEELMRNVENRTGLPILGCKVGQCSSDVESYRKVINPQDEAKAAVKNPQEPQNLAYQLLDIKKSQSRLDNDFRPQFKPVRIAPQPNNPQLTVEYREVLTAKLLLAEAELTQDRAQQLAIKLDQILLRVKNSLLGFQLPVHLDFHKLYKTGYYGIEAYTKIIEKAFNLLADIKAARDIYDALLSTQPQIASRYYPELSKQIEAANGFIGGPFTNWRDELIRLVASNFFGVVNSEISRVILQKLI
jgi:hypothetical protein